MKNQPAHRVRRLEIRPFRTDDLEGVIGLWHSCDLTRPWNDPSKDIARKLHVNPEWFLVAILSNELVARSWLDTKGIADGSIISPFRPLFGAKELVRN
jgi:hypothetical protein